jgi:hypothetical protein
MWNPLRVTCDFSRFLLAGFQVENGIKKNRNGQQGYSPDPEYPDDIYFCVHLITLFLFYKRPLYDEYWQGIPCRVLLILAWKNN